MADRAELETEEVEPELQSRLADVSYHLMMVEKFRNLAPDIGANARLREALDRHEAELRVKQQVLQADKRRIETPDA